MSRTHVSLETALSQLLVESRVGQEKTAAKGKVAPSSPSTVSAGLRKIARSLRDAPEPAVTYEDLNRVKESLYGKR